MFKCTSLLLRNKPIQWNYRHFFTRALKVNETKITTENAFNRDNFGIEDNDELNNDKKTLLWVFLQIRDACFIP